MFKVAFRLPVIRCRVKFSGGLRKTLRLEPADHEAVVPPYNTLGADPLLKGRPENHIFEEGVSSGKPEGNIVHSADILAYGFIINIIEFGPASLTFPFEYAKLSYFSDLQYNRPEFP